MTNKIYSMSTILYNAYFSTNWIQIIEYIKSLDHLLVMIIQNIFYDIPFTY